MCCVLCFACCGIWLCDHFDVVRAAGMLQGLWVVVVVVWGGGCWWLVLCNVSRQ